MIAMRFNEHLHTTRYSLRNQLTNFCLSSWMEVCLWIFYHDNRIFLGSKKSYEDGENIIQPKTYILWFEQSPITIHAIVKSSNIIFMRSDTFFLNVQPCPRRHPLKALIDIFNNMRPFDRMGNLIKEFNSILSFRSKLPYIP